MRCSNCNKELGLFSQHGTLETPLCYNCEFDISFKGAAFKEYPLGIDESTFDYKYIRKWKIELSVLSVVICITLLGLFYQIYALPFVMGLYLFFYFYYLYKSSTSAIFMNSESIVIKELGTDYLWIERKSIGNIERRTEGSYRSPHNFIIIKSKEGKELFKIFDSIYLDKKLKEKLLYLGPVVDSRRVKTLGS